MSYEHSYDIKTGVVRRLNTTTNDVDSWTVTGGTIDITSTGNGIYKVIIDTVHNTGALFATFHESALAYVEDCDLVVRGIGLLDDDTENPLQAQGIIDFKDDHRKKLVFKNQLAVGEYVLTSIITAKRS